MYEYKTILVIRQTGALGMPTEPLELPELEKAMNKYAREGWRVHQVNSGDRHDTILITFEREVRQ